MTDWEIQLMKLRGMSSVTGVLHEAQVVQLTYWGGIAFGSGKGIWTCSIDTDTKTVLYKLKTAPKRPKKLVAPIAHLDRSIHWLLGQDWQLCVKAGNLSLYTGKRKERDPDERRRREGAKSPGSDKIPD